MLSQRSILRAFGAVSLALLLPLWMLGQNRVNYTISGSVTGVNGEPLIGVAVQLAEARQGTTTEIDGRYTLSGSLAEGQYTLVVSYIGYASFNQVVTIGASNADLVQDVVLKEDALELDEVVVTGSTITSTRRQLGNALYTVDAEKLQKTGSDNLLSSLQGKVAGAQITQTSGDPAGGISVRLRGVNSLRGDSDPLYVIDGVIVSNFTSNVSQVSVDAGSAAALGTNRMADINPKDIASINIINGAAAAAIYGSRAANGVVIITTKRGQSGKPEITLSTSVNVNQLRKEVPISTFAKQFGSAALRLHTIQNNAAGPNTKAVFGRNLATNLVDVPARYDYQDEVFQTGLGTDNYLSIAGGKDNTRYFASMSYMTNEGIVKNTDFTRYGLRLNLDQTLTKWMKIGFGLNYNNSFSNEKPNGNSFFSPINSINITNNIYNITERDGNGNLRAVEPTRVNPLSIIETFDLTQEVNRIIGNLNLSIYPFKGLTLDWILGSDIYSQVGKTFIPPYPYDGVLPAYYNLGFASSVTANFRLINNDINATYDFNITDKIRSTTTAGFNYQYSRVERLASRGENLIVSTVNGSPAPTTGFSLDQFGIYGYFIQQTFGIANQLFLTGAGRWDSSTKFSSEQSNQFYPKVSASWVLSDNDFWKNTFGNGWSGMKLRASWGESGGLNAIGSYDRFWQFSPVNYVGRITLLSSTQLANPNISPERTRELEVGADLSFFNNRLNLGLTYYQQDVFDLVVNRLLAPSTGGSSIVNNVGEMENKGIEVNLGLTPVRTKDLSWDLNLVFSNNQNKITRLGSPLVAINNVAGAPAFLVEGQPAGVFFGAFQARTASGDSLTRDKLPQPELGTVTAYREGTAIPEGGYVIGGSLYVPQRNAAGQPTGSQLRRVIGDPNPDFIAAIRSSLSWKGLNFGFLFDGVFGSEVFNADKRTRQGVGIGDLAEQEMRGQLPRGWIWAMYPVEEWRIDDGTFVKLREVSLSYTLPNLFKRIRDVNIALVGRNLISWDNYNGYDPETNAGGNSDLLRGVDFGNVPIPRTYQLTVSMKF